MDRTQASLPSARSHPDQLPVRAPWHLYPITSCLDRTGVVLDQRRNSALVAVAGVCYLEGIGDGSDVGINESSPAGRVSEST